MNKRNAILAGAFIACAIIIGTATWFMNHTMDYIQSFKLGSQVSMELHYDNSKAILQVSDREMAQELAEHQPLVLHMIRKDGRYVVADMPDSFFTRDDASAGTPQAGDFVLDVDQKELAVYTQNGAYKERLIILGHVEAIENQPVPESDEFEIFIIRKE